MKFKWWFPFWPFAYVILSDPGAQRPIEMRWLLVVGSLALCAALLAIIKPWRSDTGSDDQVTLRVGRKLRRGSR